MPVVPVEPSPLRGRAFFMALRRWAPVVLPIVYVAIVFAVQPDDHFGPPDWAPELSNVLYDDVDIAAYLQRGLNSRFGQVAGLMDYPDAHEEAFAAALDEDRPLEPRCFLEYPHAALLIFRVGFWLQPNMPPVPAVVADTCHVNILHHRPAHERDRALWRCFRWAARIHFLLMLACLLGLVAVLRSGYEPAGDLSSLCLAVVLPAALYYTMNRFDIVPVLLSALSLWCLGRRRIVAAAVFLALAAAVKVYAVLLAPLVLRYLWTERRQAVVWGLAFGTTLALVLAVPLLQFGWEAFSAPYRYQLARTWTMPMTVYNAVLPAALGGDTLPARAFRMGCVLGTVGLMMVPPIPDLASLLRRGAVVLIVFQGVQIFFSPQFILWLLPFLLPLTGRHRGLIWLVVLLDLLTFFSFPIGPPSPWQRELVLRGRYLLLGLLIVLLLFWEFRPHRLRLPVSVVPAD